MQIPGEGLKARVGHRAPHLGVQDAIAIVEQRIHFVGSSPMYPPQELGPGLNYRSYCLPIKASSRAFQSHQLAALFFNRAALPLSRAQLDLSQLVGNIRNQLEPLGIGPFNVLTEIEQQVALVANLAAHYQAGGLEPSGTGID